MLTEARSSDLLYVANGNGTVTTYTYPQGRLVGTLFGFDTPEGECVDSSGNVFITVHDLSKIFEYAHGAKKPRKKLSDVGYNPTSCSIDPGTGNLAVAADPDNVAVYADAKGSPKRYTLSGSYPYCGYDDKGNLFVAGPSSGTTVYELTKGSSYFKKVTVYGSHATGAVQWDGKYLAIGNGGGSSNGMDVYRFAITGYKAKQKGTVNLLGSTTSVFWIQGSSIIALNDHANIGIWKYPAGGYPYKIVHHGVVSPNGVTISLAAR